MQQTHMTLILVSIDLVAGQSKLKEIANSFQAIGQVVETSSVYKKYLNARSEDLNSELIFVLKVETEKDVSEIFKFLENEQSRFATEDRGAFVLLTYDHLLRLFPGQNLPHPLLHSDKLTLRCAAEAWGAYEHPVLGQTLNELVRSSDPLAHVEFFAQGRNLISSEKL